MKAYWRLLLHDVAREPYFALAWAGMPPGLTGGYEATRQANAAESSASELRRKVGSEPLRPDVDSALSPAHLPRSER